MAAIATGIDIDPLDLILHVGTAIIHNITNMPGIPSNPVGNSVATNWDTFAAVISICGEVATTLLYLWLLYQTGKRGLLISIFGFQLFPLFWFASKTNAYLGLLAIILFIAGGAMCKESDGNPPVDYVRIWLE